jgi:hypothetical protein
MSEKWRTEDRAQLVAVCAGLGGMVTAGSVPFHVTVLLLAVALVLRPWQSNRR